MVVGTACRDGCENTRFSDVSRVKRVSESEAFLFETQKYKNACVFTTVPTTVPTVPTKTQGICIPPTPRWLGSKSLPAQSSGVRLDAIPARRRLHASVAVGCTLALVPHTCTCAWHDARCMPAGGWSPVATFQPDTSCLTGDCGVRSRLERKNVHSVMRAEPSAESAPPPPAMLSIQS